MRNTEVFGSFEYADEGGSRPQRAFVEIAEYVNELVRQAPDPVQRQWQLAQKYASWLTNPSVDDGRRLVVSGPRRQPLIDQLRSLLPDLADQVTVCSASFDRRLEGLRRLADMSMAPVRCVRQWTALHSMAKRSNAWVTAWSGGFAIPIPPRA